MFLVGLAVILAALFGLASTAFGANGDFWKLGRGNAATKTTALGGMLGANGAMLKLVNKNGGTDDTALRLEVQAGEAPMSVNSGARVDGLNADRVDGQDVSQIGVNGLQRVEVESPTNSSSPKQITASCPQGKVLVGTGFDVFGGKSGSSNDSTHVIDGLRDSWQYLGHGSGLRGWCVAVRRHLARESHCHLCHGGHVLGKHFSVARCSELRRRSRCR